MEHYRPVLCLFERFSAKKQRKCAAYAEFREWLPSCNKSLCNGGSQYNWLSRPGS
jgi:hypothetical protein